MIFFHDKHWYRSEPLFSVDEEEEVKIEEETQASVATTPPRSPSPTLSQETITSAPASSSAKKPEYEFLLFNYLLRFVHREGQIGDFARAGLLFLMDVAMSPGVSVHRLADDGPHLESTSADPITDAALALAEYIVDGDFSDVLGAGLCAVYSLLPVKLEFLPNLTSETAPGVGMVIGGSRPETEEEKENLEIARQKNRAMGVEEASNMDFRARLDHFLKLLEFIQDVLRRNSIHDSQDATSFDASALVGTAIVSSILDGVRRIFLENVLYPSVLECTDSDGSAVAVMSYIDIMIRTLDDGPLSDLLVNFLMSEDNDEVTRPRLLRHHSTLMLGSRSNDAPPRSESAGVISDKPSRLRRRKSSAMVLLEMEAPKAGKQSEYFTSMGRFTLKDLLLSNLRSHFQPTATAALQLLQSMVLRHSQLSINRLLIVVHDPNATSFPEPALLQDVDEGSDDDENFVYPGAEPEESIFVQPHSTYATHEREMGLYLTLVSRVDPSHAEDAFSTGYDHYLQDALSAIRAQKSFQVELATEARAKLKHRLNVNDPILALVLDSLRRFFSNNPAFNIALTGLLATLAIDPHRSLASWLTFAIHDAQQPHRSTILDFDDGDDRSIDFRIEETLAKDLNPLPASRMDEQSRPVVHAVFHALVVQLERYRQLVDNFDKYLLERRQGLLFNENLTDALTLPFDMVDETYSPLKFPPPITPESPVKIKANKTTSSLVSFLTPKKHKPTPNKVNAVHLDMSSPANRGNKNVAASPFGPHYQETSAISVEPFLASVPASGPWTTEQSATWNAEEDGVFTTQWNKKPEDDENEPTAKSITVTLSQLLDNVVILEESIKELVAIIQARRSLGIDAVRYL